MNSLQIVSIVLSMICVVITTILAWVAIAKAQKVQVTFAGTPVDKKEFEKHVERDDMEFDNLHARIGGTERGVERRLTDRINAVEAKDAESRRTLHLEVGTISRQVAKLEANDETNTTRLVQMDAKIDRLIERMK
jgi:hypothetical protein